MYTNQLSVFACSYHLLRVLQDNCNTTHILSLSLRALLPRSMSPPSRRAAGPGGGGNVGVQERPDETYVSMEVCTNVLHEAKESIRRASTVSHKLLLHASECDLAAYPRLFVVVYKLVIT
jgi:hypothetical protein